MDIGEFLAARIAEDERRLDLPDYEVVRNSSGEVSARGDGWVTRGDCPICGAYQFDGTESVTEEAWWEHAETVHQRSRVLADCDAKRAVVAYAQEVFRRNESAGTRRTLVRVEADLENLNLMNVLRLLATPYADHPDYEPEWKP